MIKKRWKNFFRYLHIRLLFRLLAFFIMTMGLFGIAVYYMFLGSISIVSVFIGIISGVAIGFLAGRIFAISWHEETEKVIMRMDKTGFFFIFLYIGFRFFDKTLLGYYLHGTALTAFSFSSLGGIMLGRLLSMLRSIEKIFKEQQIH